MRLKKFSDFGNETDKKEVEKNVNNDVVDNNINDDITTNIPTENVNSKDKPNTQNSNENVDSNKRTIPSVPKEERYQMDEGHEPVGKNSKLKESTKDTTNEEVLLTPDNKDLPPIEILEEKIVKFNSGELNEILEKIKEKFSDIDYYFRKKDNQLHIVKYNESLETHINEFVNSLLKFYSTNEKNKSILKEIRVKGNQSFSIIENIKPEFTNKFVNDLSKLLTNKDK